MFLDYQQLIFGCYNATIHYNLQRLRDACVYAGYDVILPRSQKATDKWSLLVSTYSGYSVHSPLFNSPHHIHNSHFTLVNISLRQEIV